VIIQFSDPEVKPEGLTVRFLRDGKIVAKFCEEKHVHYTLHPGTASGMVDHFSSKRKNRELRHSKKRVSDSRGRRASFS
jgi:hypothetical protein